MNATNSDDLNTLFLPESGEFVKARIIKIAWSLFLLPDGVVDQVTKEAVRSVRSVRKYGEMSGIKQSIVEDHVIVFETGMC